MTVAASGPSKRRSNKATLKRSFPEEIIDVAPGQLDRSFDVEARAVSTLGRLRNALEQVIHSISRGLQNSRDLQNILSVDRNLSWQIFKILGPIDALSTLPYIPAATSMNKLMTAVKKLGVSVESINEVNAAFAEFEKLVRATAGDREHFETMVLSGVNSVEARQVDFQHRKAAFKAHSHFFGVEVDAVVNAFVFNTTSDPTKFDLVALHDLIGLRRLRLDTDVQVYALRCGDRSDEAVIPYRMLNDEAAAIYDAPLIPEFCTSPVPPLETVTLSTGMRKTLLKSKEIGVGREIDLAMGMVYKDVTLSVHGPEGESFGVTIAMTRPTKLLVIDLIVPRNPSFDGAPYAATYAHASGEKSMEIIEREGVKMPMREELQHIGVGLDVCRVREIPRYVELLRHAQAALGLAAENWDVYRIRVEYPLMDTTLVLRVPAGIAAAGT